HAPPNRSWRPAAWRGRPPDETTVAESAPASHRCRAYGRAPAPARRSVRLPCRRSRPADASSGRAHRQRAPYCHHRQFWCKSSSCTFRTNVLSSPSTTTSLSLVNSANETTLKVWKFPSGAGTMAKKKETVQEDGLFAQSDEARQKALDAALQDLTKRFGDGSIIRLGEAAHLNVAVIPSGSLGLDIALGVGGMPRGRVVEIYGPESSGKTTLCLHVIAEAQKRGGLAA